MAEFDHLEVKPGVAPMEAKRATALPDGDNWQFEPKWDGFRCLVFRDGEDVALMSKGGKPLGRYFPDVVAAVRAFGAKRFVLDGELVVAAGDTLSFEALQMRLHPAESRVRKLAETTPAGIVLFDCLADERGASLLQCSLAQRRAALERITSPERSAAFSLSPWTRDPAEAERWLSRAGKALDGVIGKRVDGCYAPGERAMIKVKCMRSADCVVGGFRYGSGNDMVGSLLLGLYNDEGRLDHVGYTSSIPDSGKAALTKRLEALIEPPGFSGKAPGGPSRWSNDRSGDWQPLRPGLVAEVRYDHVTGNRFRHGTKFLRWRPDKAPEQCRMEQLQPEASPVEIAAILRR